MYDINHIYALRAKNTSESDPRSYEATKTVAKKWQRKAKLRLFWAFFATALVVS